MTADVDLESSLHAHGHRVTRPRVLVWGLLTAADEHLTADELTARARALDAGINRASVYRALALFETLELARQTRLGEAEAAHWEVAHADDQFHLVCTDCGAVEHHPGSLSDLRVHLRADHGFATAALELTATGRCATCEEHAAAV